MTELPPSRLASLDQVKAWLAIADTSADSDSILNRLIMGASGYIESRLNRRIAATDYSERYDGPGGVALSLRNYPIISVASLAVDGMNISEAPDTVTSGYAFSDLQIILQGYKFARGRLNVAVCYRAGYAEVPNDLAEACLELVAYKFRERDRIGQQSKSIGGEVISFRQAAEPEFVTKVITNRLRVAPI